VDDRPLARYRNYLPPTATLLAVAGTFAAAAAFLMIAGKNPLEALIVLFQSTLATPEGFSEVVVRSVPLTLTGLGIAVAFRAGVYNIGGDGQFIVGTIATAAVALCPPLGAFALPLALLAGFVVGGLFAGIPGELRARFNASEIIVTIMLNYIAFQLVGWVLRGPLQERTHIFPRSNAFPAGARLPELIDNTQLNAGLFIALAATLATHLLMRHSAFGYRLAATGESRPAAEYGGISTRRTLVAAIMVSGALCGLAGAVEVTGVFHRLEENVAPGIGIMAIAVALLAQLKPLAVPFTALLIGVLTVGAGALQRRLGVPFPLVWVLDALVIFAFLAAGYRNRARSVAVIAGGGSDG
jgi:ABC-type uncharacterized transport system permease subunit